MNAPLHHRMSGADAALAAALLDEAEQGERAILAGKVDPRHAIAYRRKVKMLREAAARLGVYASLATPAPGPSPQGGGEQAAASGEVDPLRGGRRALFLNFGLK
jgi:hypothetical protein